MTARLMPPADVITIIRDPMKVLGKHFAADGTKSSKAKVSFCIAKQYHVPTQGDMVSVLELVGEDPHAAIINSGFIDIPVGVEFLILSLKEMSARTGLDARDQLAGVHKVVYQDVTYDAVCRVKENTTPSAWQYLDRDVDAHTPAHLANLTYSEWLQRVDMLLPGVLQAGRIEMMSSSARVLRDGVPRSSLNGHTWIQVKDPADVERVRAALPVIAMERGLAWEKPRLARHGR